jgi:hypothetical protein
MNKQGQSIVEYALIAILVILGIVFMGGYVLRSVNAHFKLWDEGVQDSFKENINQASLNDVPLISTNCQCTPTPENCGSSQADASLCGPNQREVDFSCNTPGCNGLAGNATCENDPSCCAAAMSSGCGYSPIGTADNVGIDTSCPNGQDGNSIGSGCKTALPTPANPSPCQYGYKTYGFQCGTDSSQVCLQDPTCPPPACTGFILFQDSATFCTTGTSTAPITGLTQNTAITYVATGIAPQPLDFNCASANSPCAVYCNPPYTLKGNACVIQFTVAAAGTNKGCPPAAPGCTCDITSSKGDKDIVTVNTCSFQMCTASSTLITATSVIPDGPTAPATVTVTDITGTHLLLPVNNGGCGNPGEPTQRCDVAISF